MGNDKNELCPLFQKTANYQNLTIVKLPNILMNDHEDIMTKDDAITINTAVDILERAACFQKAMVLAHTRPKETRSLLEELLRVADVKNKTSLENAPIDFTLKNLNIDNSKLLIVQEFLRNVYEVHLNVEDIQLLTMERILQLEKECMGYNFKEHLGIPNYIRNVYSDELLATTEILFMPTLFYESFRYDAIDTSQPQLCIVPGVEGHHSRFSLLCERLKMPALVLQPGLDHTDETVSELAHRYAQIMLKRLELKDSFYLLGYESGVIVALKMAAILEESGLRGTVYCLGGSPDEIITHFQENLSAYKTSEQLQRAVLKHMYSLMTHENADVLDKLCQNLSWSKQIDVCLDCIVDKIPHSIQYAKRSIEIAYNRLHYFQQYTPENKILKSQLISLRPQYSFKSTDSSLQNFSYQNIISYQLQAPLSSATQDLMCSAVINQYLPADILNTYENKSILECQFLFTNFFN